MIVRTATIVSILALLAPAPVCAAQDEKPEIPKLAVRGTAELEKPADQLRISIGVVNDGRDATEVLRENSSRMADVIKALQQAGLEAGEYETGRFQVMPRYSRRPRTADEQWMPEIVGYEVRNTVNIKTRRLDKAAEIIDAANKAGANSIDSIAFDLADPRKHRAEAIAEATRNAVDDAGVLAAAASLRLVRILSISLDSAEPMPPSPMSRRTMMAGAVADAATPIEPGDVTIRASVSIIYEIGPTDAPEAAPAPDN